MMNQLRGLDQLTTVQVELHIQKELLRLVTLLLEA